MKPVQVHEVICTGFCRLGKNIVDYAGCLVVWRKFDSMEMSVAMGDWVSMF